MLTLPRLLSQVERSESVKKNHIAITHLSIIGTELPLIRARLHAALKSQPPEGLPANLPATIPTHCNFNVAQDVSDHPVQREEDPFR